MQVNDRRRRVADRWELTGAVVITGCPPRERKRAGAQLRWVGDRLATAEDVRRTGSAALELAYVACGRSDAYFESGAQTWESAAGCLMVREAGGRSCDFGSAATCPLHHETGPRHQARVKGRIHNPPMKQDRQTGRQDQRGNKD